MRLNNNPGFPLTDGRRRGMNTFGNVTLLHAAIFPFPADFLGLQQSQLLTKCSEDLFVGVILHQNGAA